MNIMGIGTDLVAQSRIAAVFSKYGLTFARRILSEAELAVLASLSHPASFLAKRFAAKEAIAKALGVGFGQFLAFKEISVTNTPNGKPQVVFLGRSKAFTDKLEVKEVMISLADEKDYALAFAVVVR